MADREPEPDFVLNNPGYARPTVLVTGENFGCGSSREHAPWALQEFVFKVLIARSSPTSFTATAARLGCCLSY
ncbi:MAG: hypothetical protein RXR20_26230 [Paraburkholderia sp.]|uniref:hypothetical protein n=1 Tax=Burkholderiaceae TaxID=119060 RepID=UPI0032C44EFB